MVQPALIFQFLKTKPKENWRYPMKSWNKYNQMGESSRSFRMKQRPIASLTAWMPNGKGGLASNYNVTIILDSKKARTSLPRSGNDIKPNCSDLMLVMDWPTTYHKWQPQLRISGESRNDTTTMDETSTRIGHYATMQPNPGFFWHNSTPWRTREGG